MGSAIANKPLHQIVKGDSIRFRDVEWRVDDKSTYPVSDQYRETQWELSDRRGNIRYLILTEELRGTAWEPSWVLTEQVSLSRVSYETDQGEWRKFKESAMPGSAPQRVRYDEIEFQFHSQHIGMARDDDDNMVQKTTWDYFESTEQRNLAIEIWKEPDKDYPEAYDGVSLDPAEVEVLSVTFVSRPTRPTKGGLAAVLKTMVSYLFALAIIAIPVFLEPSSFAAVDWVFFTIVAVMLVHLSLKLYKGLARGISFLVFVACIAVFMMFGSTSFDAVVVGSILAAILVPRLIMRLKSDARLETTSFVAWSGFLPAAWIYTTYTYCAGAPATREPYQMVAAIVVPVMLTVLAYLSISIVERMWLNRT